MTETPRKIQIQLALTPRQQRLIREATGREVNTLELRLAPLPEAAAPREHTEERAGSPEPYDMNPRRKR
jgi:hypothetical protein